MPERKTLRPSEQAGYFDVRSTSHVVTPALTVIAPADNERVGLLIYVEQAGQTANVAITGQVGGGFGLLISQTTPLILTQRDFGPLCALEWASSSTAGANLTVIEVFLRRFPGPNLEGLTP